MKNITLRLAELHGKRFFVIRKKSTTRFANTQTIYFPTKGSGSGRKSPHFHTLKSVRGLMPVLDHFPKHVIDFFNEWEVLVIELGSQLVQIYDSPLEFVMNFPYHDPIRQRQAVKNISDYICTQRGIE